MLQNSLYPPESFIVIAVRKALFFFFKASLSVFFTSSSEFFEYKSIVLALVIPYKYFNSSCMMI